MRRGGQQSLDYDWKQSPNKPLPDSLRRHLFAPDPRPKMTLISGLCAIAFNFVHDRASMREFSALNADIIAELPDNEKAQLRAVLRDRIR